MSYQLCARFYKNIETLGSLPNLICFWLKHQNVFNLFSISSFVSKKPLNIFC